MGMRIIIYIDNILMMAASKELAQAHRVPDIPAGEPGVYNQSAEVSDQPTQEIDFLGLFADSIQMELKLPGSKIKNIRSDAKSLLQRSVKTAGQVDPCTPCNEGSPLFFRHLQACLQAALQPLQDYSQPCPLTKEAKEDLNWWGTHPATCNGKSIIRGNPDLTIETDASNTGWSARCSSLQMGEPWSSTEATMHINCLELLAATLAIQTLAKKQEMSLPSEDGQHVCPDVHQQDGRYGLP